MLRLIIGTLILYLLYKYLESKDLTMPFMAWIGAGFLLAMVL